MMGLKNNLITCDTTTTTITIYGPYLQVLNSIFKRLLLPLTVIRIEVGFRSFTLFNQASSNTIHKALEGRPASSDKGARGRTGFGHIHYLSSKE